jgi:hypothetical protein
MSGFLYKTNTTFNTNTQRLPLSIIVRINNIGHTFPMAFMFITSKLANVTVPTGRHLTYARLLRALCIRLSFSPFFLYISIVQS